MMRDLIVEMNVFDGLAHNSSSILNNLAELEANEFVSATEPAERLKRHKENYTKLKRLMDAKELTSPVEVFKFIQDTLVDSGDINKFKDWVTKMRSHQEYRKQDPQLIEKLFIIYIRKAILPIRSDLNSGRDALAKHIKLLEQQWDDEEFISLINHLNATMSNDVDTLIAYLREYKEEFSKQYPDFPTEIIYDFFDPIYKQVATVVENVWPMIHHLERMQSTLENEDFKVLYPIAISTSKEVLAKLNPLSYILDAI